MGSPTWWKTPRRTRASRLDDRPAYLLTSIRAVVCVPILKSERLVAAMAVHMQSPRVRAASEIELVQRVASRSWESIERTRVERERESLLERAEAANRTKDEFLAMLGHELRNPLAPISTALQLMKLQNDSAFERERTVIERQVRHLTRLVDDLLDVSRIARAKVVLKPEPIELFEIVQRAKQRAFAAGFHHHLVKPVDLRLLETLVTNPSEAPPPSSRR